MKLTHEALDRECPHCKEKLKKYSVSSFNFSDGLGFGTPLLLVCFNDECKIFKDGWSAMFDNYGKTGSMRYWYNPVDGDEGVLPVGSREAMRGDIIEE
ncbi:MAG: hypothetical protein HQL54_08080 [Magnetococcales bacterium]|nr:hypothetical protein [Magnetococcales bacterium]